VRHPLGFIGTVLMVFLVSCSPGPASSGQPQSSSSAPSNAQPAQSRTLVVGHRIEPTNLAPKVLGTNTPLRNTRLFNAALTMIDDKGQTIPYLAEALPQLNTDSWRVFPDGKMETTYRLRDNLTWQDGAPLTSEDFAFALRVYKDRSLSVFNAAPQDAMDAVMTPDPRTLVVQWRSTNPDGGGLTFEELDPLPRHLLEAAYTDYTEGRATSDAFVGAPYWTTAYVGAGPYRLERWEPGVQLVGTAFDGHALGRPKIDRLVMRFFNDENSTLAAILTGGQIDYACCRTLRFEHFVTLKREWESAGKGTAIASPESTAFLFLQQRPEVVGDQGLLDLRVRRALAHTMDRPAINEGAFDGLGSPTESLAGPDVPFFAEIDRRMTKYPLDLNRAAQLMSEAGYTKDGEGLYADRQGARFHVDFAVQDASEIERMQQIQSHAWRQAGFDVRTVVMQTQLFTNLEVRHTLPGFSYAAGATELHFRASQVGSPANRWAGVNRSGWTNPEYDRLYEVWNGTLEQTERGSLVAQMLALVSEGLPAYPLYFIPNVKSWVSGLQGPAPRENTGFGKTSRGTTQYWDVYNWTFNK
jgi:peptide/nickel transport system substrate-binding protein